MSFYLFIAISFYLIISILCAKILCVNWAITGTGSWELDIYKEDTPNRGKLVYICV